MNTTSYNINLSVGSNLLPSVKNDIFQTYRVVNELKISGLIVSEPFKCFIENNGKRLLCLSFVNFNLIMEQ
jgi:hypothetical protein